MSLMHRWARRPEAAGTGSRVRSPRATPPTGGHRRIYIRYAKGAEAPALVFSSRCSLSQKHKQLKMAPTGEELEKQAAALRESNPGNRAAK